MTLRHRRETMPSKIEDYAMLGDGETAALVGRDGSIDWLCWPRFDSPACFAALLGSPDNGRWLLGADEPDATVTRHYRNHTLVLETVITGRQGRARVIDFMPTGHRTTHVVRLVEGLSGTVAMRTELIIRFDYGAAVPWVRRHDDDTLRAVAGPDRLTLRTPIELKPEGRRHVASFSVSAGQTIPFVLNHGRSYDPLCPAIDPQEALQRTEQTWTAWSARAEDAGPWSDAVTRSLAVLSGLTYRRSGGIVAAPTTSLPERIGGGRNWDYRFCWLRDASGTLIALMNGGYLHEAKAWRDWLLRAVGGEPDLVQILYGIGGERNAVEYELPWLPGFAGSKPVRVGNGAATQLQIDIYGEVLEALYQSRKRGLASNGDDWRLQCELLKHLEVVWTEPDEGIWEVRGGRQHFTFSKAMAWVAFDRGIRSIEEFGLEGPLDRWRDIRDRIHADVCEKAYDPAQKAFVQAYGSKELDASVLLLPLLGFLTPEDERLRSTVEAIERGLMQDGLVLRYRTERVDDGLPSGEGVFLACSFWFVDNLALIGRRDDAVAMFERLLSLRNDLGLLAEEYDPVDKCQLGNFPQAFSHLALINTAYHLARTDPSRAGETLRARHGGRRSPTRPTASSS